MSLRVICCCLQWSVQKASTGFAHVQVLLAKGISEDDLETELEEKLLDIDRMRFHDEGVNSVLVASAADEIASLRSQIDQQATEIVQLKERCCSPSILHLLQSSAAGAGEF